MSPRTLGIDLASQPGDTSACLIEWRSDGPRISFVEERLTDEHLVDLITRRDVDRVAIDAPFGWPSPFVDAIRAWRDDGSWGIELGDPEDQQRRLVLRRTDLNVISVTGLPLDRDGVARRGKQPLSVTTDKLAYTAMRCARLLHAVARDGGEPVDRSGAGRIIEVYPDAALREWGLRPDEWDETWPPLGYKGTKPEHRERRQTLVEALGAAADVPSILSEEVAARCVKSDDDLDALASALVAYAAYRGRLQPIPPEATEEARIEGWIRLPLPGTLPDLF